MFALFAVVDTCSVVLGSFLVVFWTFVGNVREVTVPWYIEMIVAFELMNIDC